MSTSVIAHPWLLCASCGPISSVSFDRALQGLGAMYSELVLFACRQGNVSHEIRRLLTALRTCCLRLSCLRLDNSRKEVQKFDYWWPVWYNWISSCSDRDHEHNDHTCRELFCDQLPCFLLQFGLSKSGYFLSPVIGLSSSQVNFFPWAMTLYSVTAGTLKGFPLSSETTIALIFPCTSGLE